MSISSDSETHLIFTNFCRQKTSGRLAWLNTDATVKKSDSCGKEKSAANPIKLAKRANPGRDARLAAAEATRNRAQP
jgi:hypothetical protein